MNHVTPSVQQPRSMSASSRSGAAAAHLEKQCVYRPRKQPARPEKTYVPSPSDRMRASAAGAGPPPGRQTATTGQVRISSTLGRCAQLLVTAGVAGGAGVEGGAGSGAGDAPCACPSQGWWTQPQRPSRSRRQAPNPPLPLAPGHVQDATVGAAPHSAGPQLLAARLGGRSSGQTRRIQPQLPSWRATQGPRPP